MIAMAIANGPELLIADEPTTALDVTIQAQVLDLLRLAQQQTGAATILITHDLDSLYAICDRVAVLADKKVIAVGTIDELLALDHPWIQEYFKGPRGRAAVASAGTAEARRTQGA